MKQSLDIRSDICIDQAHRLGRFKRDKHRQIIVAFRDYSDVESILSNAHKLKGTKYSINRDYPQEIVNAHQTLRKEYKSLKSENPDKRVKIVYPAKILMNGRVVRDAFPQWGEVLYGYRVNHKHSDSERSEHTTRKSRAVHNTNSHMRRNSYSTAPSEDSLSETQPHTSRRSRRQSRSQTRRRHAQTPHRYEHQPRDQSRNYDHPAASQPTGPDPNIRRPWDSTGDSNSRHSDKK